MIRIASPEPTPMWHEHLRRMLPTICQHARIAFRYYNPDAREEAVQTVVCDACVALARLAELDKLDLAYATVLARYGVARFKHGRVTGGHLNCKDAMSPYCQRLKHITVERLDQYSEEDQSWSQALVEDKTAGPAEIARTRIDFDGFLHSLPRRHRRIAQYLSLGNRTSEAARKFGVSQGRISQLRRALERSWKDYTGDNEGNAA